MSPNPEKIIEIKNLAKNFGKFKAVQDVSFDVYRGDVFGFLGPNGAGKSTTIRCLLSLISPTKGDIRMFGMDLGHHRNVILGKIGCIVEKPDFYKYLSAKTNLEIFARLSGKEVNKNKVSEILDFVGLKGREKDKISGFSHGMKQRLGIAQTLLHDPDLIILDEPTTGLDPQGIIDIRNLILQLKNEGGKTVLLSSHILSEIELIADRMVIINKGRTLVQGKVSELLNTGDMVVSFSVDVPEVAWNLVKEKLPDTIIEGLDGGELLLHLSKREIPEVNRLLCDNGVNVFAIEARRKLEDYFLKLVRE